MKLQLWLVQETDKARQFSKLPPERHPELLDFIWIPRSLTSHVSKSKPLPNGWRLCEPEVEDWFCERNGL